MDATLRGALWGFLRPLVQLITNLLSPEVSEGWEREFKKFLRKEPCWVKSKVGLAQASGHLRDKQKNGSRIRDHELGTPLKETTSVYIAVYHGTTQPENGFARRRSHQEVMVFDAKGDREALREARIGLAPLSPREKLIELFVVKRKVNIS